MKLALEIINREIAQRELANKHDHLRKEICTKEIDELKQIVNLLSIQNVSGISLEQLKLQKECYRERKERNGKANAYGEAYTDEIREGVIDHLIALCNYR